MVGGSIVGGSTQTRIATVTISRDPGDTGTVSVGITVPTYVDQITSVTVPAGSNTATFTLSASQIMSTTQVATITAYLGPSNASDTLTVKPFSMTLTFAPSSVIGGSTQTATGTLTLDAPLKAQTSISPGTNNANASVSTGVIPPGGTTTQFDFQYNAVVENTTNVLVTATLGSNATATVQATPYNPVITITPATIHGGSTELTTVTVSVSAPVRVATGFNINCNPFTGLIACSGVTIPAGGTSGSYQARASFTNTDTNIVYTVTTGVDSSATLTIRPISITITGPNELGFGQTQGGTVTLDAPVFASNSVGISFVPFGFPASATSAAIPAGGSSGTFTVTGGNVSQVSSGTYSGALGGQNRQSNVLPLTVVATQNPTQCDHCEGTVGHPINLANGNVWIEQTDYVLPGLGGGIALSRTWNSRWWFMSPPSQDGAFGNGFTSTYEERLQTLTGGVTKWWLSNGDSWTFLYNSTSATYTLLTPANRGVLLAVDPVTTNRTIYFKDGSRHIFNSSGYLIGMADRNGNASTVNLDASSRITSVVDAAGRTLTFNYPNSSIRQVSSIQDSVGTVATYTYNGTKLTRVTYADASQANFAYDSNGMIISVTDAAGKVLESHTYGTGNKGLTSARANNVDKVTVSYPSSTTTHVVDSLGNASDYTLGTALGRGTITAINGPGCNSCGGRGVNTYAYDWMGNRTSSTNASSQNATMTYDASGNVLTRTVYLDANTPLTTTYTYNSLGQVLTATDPAGNVTTNTYDTHGNLLTTTTPSPASGVAGSTTTFEYFTNGLLKKVTDPRNNATSLTYTAAGLIQTITDAQSNVTTFAYDARGNRTSITDADNKTTTFTYDAMNRLTRVTNPDTTYTQFAYDARGRRTLVTDANNKVTTYAYDDADRLTSVTDAANNVTTYAYDTENNLTGITDALNRTTNFQYDSMGRVTKTIFPSTLYETYNYDNLGNLLSKVDRKSNTTTYYYDGLNRMYKKHYQDGTEVNYTYDNLGRLTQASDATGTYGLSYDNLGRVTGTTTQYAFLTGQTFTMAYGYDAASNRTSFTDPQSGVTSYVYDTLNRLTSLTNPQSQQFTFGYDVLGRRTSLARPNNVTTSYTYDSLSRLLSVLHKDSTNAVIDGATYTVDNVGNRTAKTNNRTNVPESYSYDPIYQLTQVQQTISGTPTTTETYAYDKVGNRTSSLNTATYTVNSSNQLTSTTNSTYSYDNNGNTLTDSGKNATYAWDLENRLSQVSFTGGGTVTYKYDPFGRRIYRAGPSGTTIWLYDGANIVNELNGTGAFQATYTQGSGVDEPLAMLRGSTTDYYEADGLGSVTSLSDSSGTIAETYTYDAYGNLTAGGTTLNNPFRYTGREWDQDVGLYYYRARYYDSSIGRFLAEDEFSFNEGINFYRYVGNSPALLTDPSGLTVEAPGFWESLIPIWGSGKQAIHEFQCGNYGWAAFNAALAISDVFLVKSAITAVGKVGVEGLLKVSGSHTWDATRKWMTRSGWREFSGQPFHHWLVPQKGWGELIPNALKNQPWNIQRLSEAGNTFHNMIEGKGADAMGLVGRLFHGSPTWAKVAAADAEGKVINAATSTGVCGCN